MLGSVPTTPKLDRRLSADHRGRAHRRDSLARIEPARRPRPQRQCDRVRRRRRRDPRHARAADERRRPQRRLAGDQGRRRLLQHHEGHAQQPAGHVLRLDAREARDLAQLQPPQRRPLRRGLRLRDHPRPAARRNPDVPRRTARATATASGSGAATSTSRKRRCRSGTSCGRTSSATTRRSSRSPHT